MIPLSWYPGVKPLTDVIEYLENGGEVYPVSLIRREGAPFTAEG